MGDWIVGMSFAEGLMTVVRTVSLGELQLMESNEGEIITLTPTDSTTIHQRQSE